MSPYIYGAVINNVLFGFDAARQRGRAAIYANNMPMVVAFQAKRRRDFRCNYQG